MALIMGPVEELKVRPRVVMQTKGGDTQGIEVVIRRWSTAKMLALLVGEAIEKFGEKESLMIDADGRWDVNTFVGEEPVQGTYIISESEQTLDDMGTLRYY